MKRLTALLLALALVPPVAAQDMPSDAAPAEGWRAEFLKEVDHTESYLLQLAEAVPEELYTWRPAEGVRSFSEVLLHIATANYGLPRRLGRDMPEGFQPRGFETSTTDKAEVVAALRASFGHLRAAVLAADEGSADASFDWFDGGQQTRRGLLLFITRHSSEHLGQLIAYARMNGVVPPWSS